MTPTQLNSLLCDRILEVCRHLLPNGKKVGHEWQCGSLDGEAGHSLNVHLDGRKTGVWADFADTARGGDLIDLWRAVRGIDLRTTLAEVKAWLGVAEEDHTFHARAQWQRPQRPDGFGRVAAHPRALAYLTGRRLTLDTLTAFRIAASEEEIAFPSFRDDHLINIWYLTIDRQDGKKRCRQEAKCEPSLFGWQAMNPDAREAVITEGQIDAMTVHQWGFPALSMPGGANGGHGLDWIEVDYERLQQFDTLYLCTDMDDAGRRILPEMVRRLGAERCRLVDLPYYKDANEALQAGMTADQFHDCLRVARSQDPAELKPATAFAEEVLRCFYPDPHVPRGMDTPFQKLNEQDFYFEPGAVTLWSGYSGSGKSLILGYFALCGMEQNYRWCIASMEMKPAKTLMRMVRQHARLACPAPVLVDRELDWMAERLWVFDVVGVAKRKRLLEVFRYAARRYGITQYVVDSLAKFDIDEEDYSGQKDLINDLVAFAHEHQAHVHLVAHPRKALNEDQPPGKLDVRGGAALTDLVDNVLVVFRNRKALPAQPNGALIVQKRRNEDGEEGWMNLWFNKETLCYADHAQP